MDLEAHGLSERPARREQGTGWFGARLDWRAQDFRVL